MTMVICTCQCLTGSTYLSHCHYKDSLVFCWGEGKRIDCGVFSPCPKCTHYLSLCTTSYWHREASYSPSGAFSPHGEHRSERWGPTEWDKGHPGGEPCSVRTTDSFLGLIRPPLLLLLHPFHSRAHQREQTRRWCRTSQQWPTRHEENDEKFSEASKLSGVWIRAEMFVNVEQILVGASYPRRSHPRKKQKRSPSVSFEARSSPSAVTDVFSKKQAPVFRKYMKGFKIAEPKPTCDGPTIPVWTSVR